MIFKTHSSPARHSRTIHGCRPTRRWQSVACRYQCRTQNEQENTRDTRLPLSLAALTGSRSALGLWCCAGAKAVPPCTACVYHNCMKAPAGKIGPLVPPAQPCDHQRPGIGITNDFMPNLSAQQHAASSLKAQAGLQHTLASLCHGPATLGAA